MNELERQLHDNKPPTPMPAFNPANIGATAYCGSALTSIGDGVYKFTQEDPVKVTIHSCTVEVSDNGT